MESTSSPDPLDSFRQILSLRRDVLVLSAAMFAFSLGFQMTSRYIPAYIAALGGGAGAIGLFGSAGNLISALYPYPGGWLSDRIGSRSALTLFGVASTVGFLVWLTADWFGSLTVGPLVLPSVSVAGFRLGGTLVGVLTLPIGIFLGLGLTQAWKSLGLGATFAIVKQSTAEEALATGFASTETFRRIGFLLGPLLAAGVLATAVTFVEGIELVLALAAVFAAVGTLLQYFLYDSESDSLGKSFEGVGQLWDDLRSLPDPLRPLLFADTLIRFANGMVYVFFVIVVTEFLAVEATVLGTTLEPATFFGVLLGLEMVVALISMYPTAKLAERVGLKPVVALGFSVYAIFPVLLILAPANALILGFLFAFSGLRFAGLPAHKALIVGPAEASAGGRVTGAYYLVRNLIVIPSAALGGWLYARDPVLAFSIATVIGLCGTAYFLLFGVEFEPYKTA